MTNPGRALTDRSDHCKLLRLDANVFSDMKILNSLVFFAAVASSSLLLSSCSSPSVQEARLSGIENRQSRIDSRTAARQERWRIRGEREDARAAARFDSW
jgi:hypothetical protein